MDLLLFWSLFITGIIFTLAIYFDWVRLNMRYVFLFMLMVGIFGSVYTMGLSFRDLGMIKPSLISMAIYGLVTLAAWMIIECTDIRQSIVERETADYKFIDNGWFYVLISTPLQEIMARAYPLAVFNHFGWRWINFVIFSAAIFSFSHIFLKNKYLTGFTFLIGLIWSGVYYWYPDFWSLSASHAILGAILLAPRRPKYSSEEDEEIEIY